MLTNEPIESAEFLLNDATWTGASPLTPARSVNFTHQAEHAATHCLLSYLGFSNGQPELAATKILEILAKSFDSPIAMLWVPDVRSVALRCEQSWTDQDPINDGLVAELSEIELWPVEALPGRVWAQGRGEIVHEVASDRHLGRATLFPKSGIRSAFAIPAKVDSETLCVLELLSREPLAFQSVSPLQMHTLSDALGILFRHAPLAKLK
ncbi:MAG TPA: GAF domain-containing protein [Bryobacteraceae bacterium]|nr:GAF domain-containing protein [Bryobacteraceae bacterium]